MAKRYSITERRFPELIPVLDSQPAGSLLTEFFKYKKIKIKRHHFLKHEYCIRCR